MKMSDEQLLRAAAKAAGLVQYTEWTAFVHDHDSEHFGESALHKSGWGGDCDSWNPLTHDGDAFRLAVALNIEFFWADREGCSLEEARRHIVMHAAGFDE
jgi:hypothetical protein